MEESTLDPMLEPDQGEPMPGDTPPPPAGDGDAPPSVLPTRSAPALTIHIQSWATPVIGLVMLAFGLLAGYYAHPIWNPSPTPVAQAPTSESSSAASAEQPAPTQPLPEDQAARQQQLMEVVISRTRHFRGDANAPVTLVEFSDFQ